LKIKFQNKILTILNHLYRQKVLKRNLIIENKVKKTLLKRKVNRLEVIVIEADHALHLNKDTEINLDHQEEDSQGLHHVGIKEIDQDLQGMIKDQDSETKILDKISFLINYHLCKSLNLKKLSMLWIPNRMD